MNYDAIIHELFVFLTFHNQCRFNWSLLYLTLGFAIAFLSFFPRFNKTWRLSCLVLPMMLACASGVAALFKIGLYSFDIITNYYFLALILAIVLAGISLVNFMHYKAQSRMPFLPVLLMLTVYANLMLLFMLCHDIFSVRL